MLIFQNGSTEISIQKDHNTLIRKETDDVYGNALVCTYDITNATRGCLVHRDDTVCFRISFVDASRTTSNKDNVLCVLDLPNSKENFQQAKKLLYDCCDFDCVTHRVSQRQYRTIVYFLGIGDREYTTPGVSLPDWMSQPPYTEEKKRKSDWMSQASLYKLIL